MIDTRHPSTEMPDDFNFILAIDYLELNTSNKTLSNRYLLNDSSMSSESSQVRLSLTRKEMEGIDLYCFV